MESKAKLFGHAIHPIMIVLPLGSLIAALVFDVIALLTRNGYWTGIAYYLIGFGVITGALAAVFGWIDYLSIPNQTRAKAIGLWHGIGNVIVLLLFLASCVVRNPAPESINSLAMSFSLAGILLALVTGWLGGELVGRLGVGIDDGAHLNAPNSLSGKPAMVSNTPTSQASMIKK